MKECDSCSLEGMEGAEDLAVDMAVFRVLLGGSISIGNVWGRHYSYLELLRVYKDGPKVETGIGGLGRCDAGTD